MHWTKKISMECLAKGDEKIVIETGTSISGIPHIGNASDVIRGEAVRKTVEKLGHPVELIWVSDDSDPFRSIPAGCESLSEYLGFPVKDIPDPDGCHDSFVDHFAKPFLEALEKFGVKPTVYSGTEIYRSGALVDEIRTALERRSEIIEILNGFRDNPLPESYIPFTPICEKCGKISTTKATGIEGDIVSYECVTQEVKGGEVKGCGHVGSMDISDGNGKLPWRVEWAARWNHFKVTCEPFGKDHASAGGSYWSSKVICEKIFNRGAPVPVMYEFFTLNGDKISSSKGNVITPGGWLEISEPEVLNYFMYKKLNKQRDIDLSRLSQMVDEYDEAETRYFENPDVEENDHFLLSQVSDPKRLNVPFTLCAVLAQILPEIDEDVVNSKVSSQGYVGYDLARLVERVKLSGNWISQFGPDHLKFSLNSLDDARKQFSQLEENERNALRDIVGLLDKGFNPQDFHKQIYDVSRANDVKPPKIFKALYKSLIGKDKGPKAASFLLSLDKKFLCEVVD